MILLAAIAAALLLARAAWLAIEISEDRRKAWRNRRRY
jgi:hypothetical protein